MTSPKYCKFNTGRTKQYFPLLRWRFNTDDHPVIKSTEKCASSTARSKFSMQELQMLVGLTNTLQCNEREAVRLDGHSMRPQDENLLRLRPARDRGNLATGDRRGRGIRRARRTHWLVLARPRGPFPITLKSQQKFLRPIYVWACPQLPPCPLVRNFRWTG